MLTSQTKPLKDHVFQTIFLNNKHQHLWSKDEIRKDKISTSLHHNNNGSPWKSSLTPVREDWWHQLCHSWTHYAFVVPWIWLLNWNSKHTTYAGAWTLVNAHELAIISGQAAAYKLGADYQKELYENDFARLCFRLYLLLAHGTILSKKRVSA